MQFRGGRILWCFISLGLFFVATSFALDANSSKGKSTASAIGRSVSAPIDFGPPEFEDGLPTPYFSTEGGTSCADSWLDSGTYTCCPTWTTRAGVVFLRRDNQNDRLLSNGATPISVDGLSLDYEAGPLFNVIRHGILQTAWDLEVNYFGVHDFDATASSAGATTIFSIPNINFGASTVTSTYSSQLDSTEMNFRRPWNDWLVVLGGFRWVEIGDQLATNVLAASHTINVNNHLYGAQLGAEAMIWSRNAFALEFLGKAGVYRNQADQSTTIVNVGGANPFFSAAGADTAFVGELALTGSYAINDRWSARGGYQVLWVDGVALAPDQIDASDIVTGAATLNTGGDPIYHGFTLAAEYVW